MRCARIAAALGLAASLGCMTIDTQRDPDYHGPQVYSGVRKDSALFGEAVLGFALPVAALLLADMPLSFLADTVLLPVTIPRDSESARQRAEQAEVAAERPSPVTPRSGEAPLEIARRLFDTCERLLKRHDPRLADCYSIDARIDVAGRGAARGADYKLELRTGLARDASDGTLVEWRNPTFAADGERVRIEATRASSLDPPRTPLSLVVGPCADGAWRIVEESSIGWTRP